ncbi:unnamed protein product [Protopolystoma xenopodis]|uniref:Uncharacterized protein n=1 Tax=Protopolystoma xenopodis TaxID=117903 RepID=A0A448XKS3_9PLAT|nr:unnamed protein product [Protopolystoma xenopodis]
MGQPDNRTTGQPDNRTIEQPDNRTTGQLDKRKVDNRTTGQPNNRTIGQLDKRTSACAVVLGSSSPRQSGFRRFRPTPEMVDAGPARRPRVSCPNGQFMPVQLPWQPRVLFDASRAAGTRLRYSAPLAQPASPPASNCCSLPTLSRK